MRDNPNDLEAEELEFLKHAATAWENFRARGAHCPNPELLLAARSGVLAEEISRNINAHTETCAFCRILANDLALEEIVTAKPEEVSRVYAKLMSTVRESSGAKTEQIGGLWFWLRRAAPAAALAGIVLAAVWIRFYRTLPPNRTTQVAPQLATKPVVSSVFQWEKLPAKVDPSTFLVWRGAPKKQQQEYGLGLARAFAFYQSDDFSEAAKLLAVLAAKYPRRPEAHLYLGVSQLYLQKNTEAIASLRAAQESSAEPLADDAAWYLALAYQRVGESDFALTELRKLCGNKGAYTDRACAGIAELESRRGGTSSR